MKYERLKELRLESRLTQTQIGAVLGVDQRTYSSYELGLRGLSTEVLIALADYYDVSIDYIVGRTDKKTWEK